MYKDLARGNARELADLQTPGPPGVEKLVFQLASNVAQLKRLVEALGTPKDTVDHRRRLTDQNHKVQDLAKQIKEKLTEQSGVAATPQQQTKTQKLMQDFAAILQDYKSTQKQAADKEAACLPRTPPPPPRPARPAAVAAATTADGEPEHIEVVIERQALLQEQQQADARLLDNSITYNEALIEERDESIAEIQRNIGEVNEIFQDLAVLIHDQGATLQTVDNHITSTAERTREANRELVKAERSQMSARNKCLMLWLVAAIVLSIIIIALFA